LEEKTRKVEEKTREAEEKTREVAEKTGEIENLRKEVDEVRRELTVSSNTKLLISSPVLLEYVAGFSLSTQLILAYSQCLESCHKILSYL